MKKEENVKQANLSDELIAKIKECNDLYVTAVNFQDKVNQAINFVDKVKTTKDQFKTSGISLALFWKHSACPEWKYKKFNTGVTFYLNESKTIKPDTSEYTELLRQTIQKVHGNKNRVGDSPNKTLRYEVSPTFEAKLVMPLGKYDNDKKEWKRAELIKALITIIQNHMTTKDIRSFGDKLAKLEGKQDTLQISQDTEKAINTKLKKGVKVTFTDNKVYTIKTAHKNGTFTILDSSGFGHEDVKREELKKAA